MANILTLDDKQFDKLLNKLEDIIDALDNIDINTGEDGGSEDGSGNILPFGRQRSKRYDMDNFNYDDFDTDAYENSIKEERRKKLNPFGYYKETKTEYANAKQEFIDAKNASMADPENADKKKALIKAQGNYNAASNKMAGGKAGAAAAVSAITDALLKIADSVSNIILLEMKKDQAEFVADMEKKTAILEANSKTFNNSLQLASNSFTKSLQSSFQSITSGVREGAYAAATSMLTMSTDALNKELERQQIEMHKLNTISIAEQTLQNEKLKNNTEQLKEIGAMTATAAGAVAAIPAVGWVASAVIVAGGALAAGITAISAKMQQAESEMALERQKMRKEYNEKQLEAITNTLRSVVEGAQQIAETVLSFANDISSLTEKMDDAFTKAGRNLGLNGESLDNYKDRMFKESKNLYVTNSDGSRTFFDKTGEDLAKLQTQYTENTGFSIELQHDDFMKTFAMGKLWGDDVMADLVSQMQLFNHSAADSSDIFFEMYDNARKAGISQEKFAKQIQKDLKLANKYQFKGGTKGLMEMSIWAQKTRFNMDSLSGMLDKIQDGGLENLITSGAQLQVLGGNFAMGADPLAMGWEAFNDPEALAKRQNNMLKGMGRYDASTGEVKFNAQEQMMMKEFAKITGQNIEDVQNQRRQAIKSNVIEKEITKNYTEEEKSLIYAKAVLKDGQWQVNGKDINDLNKDDFAELKPHEEKIEYYVGGIYSMLDKMTGVTNYGQASTVDDTKTSWYDNMNKQMEENVKFFEENAEQLKTLVTSGYEYMTKANEEMHDFMSSSAESIDEVFTTMSKVAEDMHKNLTDANGNFKAGLKAFNEGAEAFKKYCKEVADIDVEGMDGGDKDLAEQLVKVFSNKDNVGTYDVKHLREFLNDSDPWAWHDITGKNHGFTNETEDRFFKALPEKYKQMIREDSGSILKQTLQNIKDGKYGDLHISGFNDGVVGGNGQSMSVSASKVTPINDGAVAKTNPNDHGIFAKVGGPFDKLFNGVFGQINEVHSMLSPIVLGPLGIMGKLNKKFGVESFVDQIRQGGKKNTVEAKSYDPFNGLKIIDKVFGTEFSGKNSKEQNSQPMQPIEIKMSGSIELTSQGKSINIIDQLRQDPILLRQVTKLVSENISKTMNGGRDIYNGGDLVSFRGK